MGTIPLHSYCQVFQIFNSGDAGFRIPGYHHSFKVIIRLGKKKMFFSVPGFGDGRQNVDMPSQSLVIGLRPGKPFFHHKLHACFFTDQCQIVGGDPLVLVIFVNELKGDKLRVNPEPDHRVLADKSNLLLSPVNTFISTVTGRGYRGND